ncbi:MAG: hypothetical protein J6N78_04215 [Clostridia bacterium]|nr:hypothetical protein [Clostridia bacterium]
MLDDKKITEIGLPRAITANLYDEGIEKLSDLLNLTNDELKQIKNIGVQKYYNIKIALYSLGHRLKDDCENLDLKTEISNAETYIEINKYSLKQDELQTNRNKLNNQVKIMEKERAFLIENIQKYTGLSELVMQSPNTNNTSEIEFLESILRELFQKLNDKNEGIQRIKSNISEIDSKIIELEQKKYILSKKIIYNKNDNER